MFHFGRYRVSIDAITLSSLGKGQAQFYGLVFVLQRVLTQSTGNVFVLNGAISYCLLYYWDTGQGIGPPNDKTPTSDILQQWQWISHKFILLWQIAIFPTILSLQGDCFGIQQLIIVVE